MQIRHNLFPITHALNPVRGLRWQPEMLASDLPPEVFEKGIRFSTGGFTYHLPEGEMPSDPNPLEAFINLNDFPSILAPSVLEIIAEAASTIGGVDREGKDLLLSTSTDPSVFFKLSIEPLEDQLHLLVCAKSMLEGQTIEGRKHYEHVDDLVGKLINAIPRKSHGLALCLSRNAEESQGLGFQKMPSPTYHFSSGGLNTSPNRQKSLHDIGPFSRRAFQHTEIHLLTIYRREDAGDFETLIKGFKDGYPYSQSGGHHPWPKGFKDTFRTGEMRIHKILLEGNSFPANLSKVREKISELRSKGILPKLALFQAPSQVLSPENDLYPLLKSCLMDYGIPSQGIRVELASQVNAFTRAEAMFNIALASYAKMGGKPWLLSVSHAVAHEFVIGMGTAKNENGSASHLGFSAIFSSMGDYKIGTSNHLVEVKNAHEIAAELARMLKEVKRADNWATGDTVRLIFHLHESVVGFPSGEVKKHLIESLGAEHELSFSFLCLRYDHCYRLWDLERADWGLREKAYLPHRGLCMWISNSLALLQLQPSVPSDPFIPPLSVQLDQAESDFIDMRYLCQQLHDFSAISWRSTKACHLPVTVEYGQELTRLLSIMQSAGAPINQNLGWDNLRRLPWYL